jgi:hypothetical protein
MPLPAFPGVFSTINIYVSLYTKYPEDFMDYFYPAIMHGQG